MGDEEVVEIFDTLNLVAAIQLYLFAKIHRTVHLKKSKSYGM